MGRSSRPLFLAVAIPANAGQGYSAAARETPNFGESPLGPTIDLG
jgi:hypothetical protein